MNRTRSAIGRAALPAINIVIEETMWRTDPEVVPLIRRAARTALRSARAGPCPLAVTILLAGDNRLRDLNAKFRNRHGVTNVLSFPAPREQAPYLGDIALGFGILCREAKAQRKTLAQHAAHLTIHGILHLLGYDHERSREAAIMEKLEISHLARIGVRDPYRPIPVRSRPKQNKFASCKRLPAR